MSTKQTMRKWINALVAIIALVVVSGIPLTGFSQDTDREKVIKELKTISDHYRNTRFLSFDINYRYANEQQPGIYLDSLSGSFKINGSNYWYVLDNTEAIGDNHYLIMLFREDKIMYLTKPSSLTLMQNPLALIDSYLVGKPGVRYGITSQKKEKKISLDFGDNGKYRKIEYEIDAASGFMTKMTCVVRASEMYDETVRSQVDDASVYVKVEAVFKNYRETAFPENLVNTTKYFKKDGEEYIALPPYETYKVFLGTNTL
jgi:hypothetical protein